MNRLNLISRLATLLWLATLPFFAAYSAPNEIALNFRPASRLPLSDQNDMYDSFSNTPLIFRTRSRRQNPNDANNSADPSFNQNAPAPVEGAYLCSVLEEPGTPVKNKFAFVFSPFLTQAFWYIENQLYNRFVGNTIDEQNDEIVKLVKKNSGLNIIGFRFEASLQGARYNAIRALIFFDQAERNKNPGLLYVTDILNEHESQKLDNEKIVTAKDMKCKYFSTVQIPFLAPSNITDLISQ